MSEEQEPKSGSGRLLSKVVRFITSPTTDWSDLDRMSEQSDAAASASSLELKQMIERKRRNDFVRNREFNMLRKLRQHQLSGSGSTSSVSSVASSVSDSSADAYRNSRSTLQKIDEIEEEMSRSWLDRPPSQQPVEPERAPERAASSLAAASDPQLDHSFAPTEIQSPPLEAEQETASPSETLGSMLDMHFDDTGRLMSPELGQPADGIPVLSESYEGLPEPVIELDENEEEQTADLMLSPAMEDVAIRFANGDLEGAEVSLLGAISEQGEHAHDEQAWLSLFDLYRAAGENDKFDGAAMAFVNHFGRSAPQWQQAAVIQTQAAVSAPARAPTPAPRTAQAMHWTAPVVINVQAVAGMRSILSRTAAPWRLDWRRVKTVDGEALAAVLELLRSWTDSPVSLQFLGGEALLQVLEAESPTDHREANPHWWEARLALLQIMGEVDEFDLVALNYCVTYEVSPPAWERPQCRFAVLDSSGQVVQTSDFDSSQGSQSTLFGISTIGPVVDEPDDVARLPLQGELLGEIHELLQSVPLTEHTGSIELNFRKVQRVDFVAAGDLLNWVVEQKSQGRPVVLRHVNRLVAAFLAVIGVNDVARVMRRKD